ncbi:MAG TPA: hypothetical protein VJ841_00035 [Candidatus Saccharimonadales bacterium]|nr:hypothetical protein [Candidatus Saccharimonadales bacterium]
MEQRVGDGVLVHLVAKQKAGLQPTVAERLVRARRVPPRTRQAVRVVLLRDCKRDARRLQRRHEWLLAFEDARTATPDRDLVEPKTYPRIAAKQADDSSEQPLSLRLRSDSSRPGDVKDADHPLRHPKENGVGDLLVDVTHDQRYVTARGARNERSIPSLALSEECVVLKGHDSSFPCQGAKPS